MIPRATASGPGVGRAIISETLQDAIPTHVQHVPGMGDVLFHHAEGVNVVTVAADNGVERIALIVAQRGCDCGCNARGRGLLLTPDVAGARRLADRLIKMADRFEAEAATSATALLDRVRGK